MRIKLFSFLTLAFLASFNSQLATLHAQGTVFTYQGRLNDGSSPANGSYDLRFAIYDALAGGVPQGSPVTNAATGVNNGLFSVTLDFGAGIFTGADRWLEIGARTNGGGAFTTLSPRHPITPTPYAITAKNLSGGVTASQVNGMLSVAQLPAAVVTNGASGVNLAGTFSGDGAGMTNGNLALNSGGTITWPGIFPISSSLAVGGSPRAVLAVDVNGDGKVDLISANSGSNTLTVFMNNGSGGFVLSSSPSVGNSPRSVVAADVNGDGKVDLISANYFDHNLTVLTNNGSGGFAPSSSPFAGLFPYSVVSADVNGDGKVDLINANASGPSPLTVLTNNGNGGFVMSSMLGTTAVSSVTAADVNGDGKVDLITADYNANTLSVLTNNGSGGFVLSSSPGVGSNPLTVIAVDVNGDGRLDLISANSGDYTLTVLINYGSGGFLPDFSPHVGAVSFSVVAADINGDGKLELISANDGYSSLTVLTNNGSGDFQPAFLIGVGVNPVSVTAADVNGDGRPDLISANYTANTLTVLLNAPTFSGGFAGDGSGLTSLNAGNLTGAVPSASLTSVPAGNLTGTVPDARLSVNVALRAGGNTFYDDQICNGRLTVRTTADSSPGSVTAFDTRHMVVGTPSEGIAISYSSPNGKGYITALAPNVAWKDLILQASTLSFRPSGGVEALSVLNNGFVGIGTNAPQQKLHVIGNILASGTISGSSDRNVKEHFNSVDAREVLAKVAALPIARWNYKTEKGVTHLGPMAQDFYSAFAVGADDKHISMVDADGVALAAIQGLNEKVEAGSRWSEARSQKLETENAELKARLEKLEQLLEHKFNGGAR